MKISELKRVAKEYRETGLAGFTWDRWQHLLDLIEHCLTPDRTAGEMREWIESYSTIMPGVKTMKESFIVTFGLSKQRREEPVWHSYTRFIRRMSHAKAHDA